MSAGWQEKSLEATSESASQKSQIRKIVTYNSLFRWLIEFCLDALCPTEIAKFEIQIDYEA